MPSLEEEPSVQVGTKSGSPPCGPQIPPLAQADYPLSVKYLFTFEQVPIMKKPQDFLRKI